MFDKSNLLTIFAFILALNFVGCGTGNLDNVDIPIPDFSEDRDPNEITSTLAAPAAASDVSPASMQFQLPPSDASAKEVAIRFIEFLNNEDRGNFELLLTPAALNAVTKIKFQLPPIADPGTKFVGAEPKFATIRQKVCFVNCESSATADQDAVSGLSLMMRKTKSGWRVAGMMLMDEEQETQNLLSFENLTDLGQIKDSVQFIDTEMDSQ